MITEIDSAATADNVVIKCAGLTKTFLDMWHRPRVRAVVDLDLEVMRGEVFGLLGPNGSGKSTTIKLTLGLLRPTSGHVFALSKRPDDVNIKSQIGYLPEESYLYPFLNARETLEYYGRLFHQNRAKRKSRIDMLLKLVGLDAVWRRPVGEYSKGMQRRIGLAQALINDPQLLILDEPTTGLDPIGTRQIKDLINELAHRGKTVVLCSHLLTDVEDVCNRVAIMFGGKIHALGTCDQLLVQQNVTNISVPAMDEQQQQQVIEMLENRGVHDIHIEQPRQRLETLFLNIVHQAQKAGDPTSGATSGGQIAEFLMDKSPPKPVEGAEVIDQLITEAAMAPMVDENLKELAPEPDHDAAIVEQLTKGPAPPPKPAGTPSAPTEPEPEKKPDQNLIDSLIERPDQE